jgi:hypothetical protein
MSTLRIYLFGKFCVRRNERLLDGFDARKVQELLRYLLLHRDHSLPRGRNSIVQQHNSTRDLSL